MQVQKQGTYFGPFLLSERGVRHIQLKKPLANSRELQRIVQDAKRKRDEVTILAGREQLPNDIMLWVNKVDSLGAVFSQYCENVIFCSFMRYRGPDGRIVYERGFAYSIEKEESLEELSVEAQERVVEYDQNRPIYEGGPELEISALERTLFVNLFDLDGIFYEPPALFPIIAHEVAHLENNAWINRQGCGLADFGLEAREFYATMFERNALIGLRNAINGLGGYESLVSRAITERVIPFTHERALSKYAEMSANELARFSFPPGFDIKNLRLFRQYPVSMIG